MVTLDWMIQNVVIVFHLYTNIQESQRHVQFCSAEQIQYLVQNHIVDSGHNLLGMLGELKSWVVISELSAVRILSLPLTTPHCGRVQKPLVYVKIMLGLRSERNTTPIGHKHLHAREATSQF